MNLKHNLPTCCNPSRRAVTAFSVALGGVWLAGLMLLPKSAVAFQFDFSVCSATGLSRVIKGLPYEE